MKVTVIGTGSVGLVDDRNPHKPAAMRELGREYFPIGRRP